MMVENNLVDAPSSFRSYGGMGKCPNTKTRKKEELNSYKGNWLSAEEFNYQTEFSNELATDYKNLTISNDFMFRTVMTENVELLNKILKVLLDGQEISNDLEITQQAEIDSSPDNKSTKMDICVYDKENGAYYDLEMQVKAEKGLVCRARYYLSSLINNAIKKGDKKYKVMNPCYVIFICLHDPLKAGLAVYKRQAKLDTTAIDYDEKSGIVYFDAKNYDKLGEDKEDLKNLLKYFYTNIASDELTHEIHRTLQKVKRRTSVRNGYMHLRFLMADQREEGRIEGRDELLEQQLTYKKYCTVMSDKEIMEKFNIDKDTLDKIKLVLSPINASSMSI